MKILADENIPLLEEFFADLGELKTKRGREIEQSDLIGIDVLLVRSVTKVDEKLLQNTGVKLVASATSGIEHIDTKYLEQAGIRFISTPGANATSVVEYLISSLLWIAQRDGFLVMDKVVGIVGLGNVGKKLKEVLEDLGIKVLVNDPPLEKQGFDAEFTKLEDLIAQSDIITLHTPLTKNCEDATQNLINEELITKIKPNSILINASRGGVLDESALKNRLNQQKDLTVILDVFANEPNIDKELVDLIDLATPHIAGYSLDAKFEATARVYNEVVKFFGLPARVKLGALEPETWLKTLSFAPSASPIWAIRKAVRGVYDPRDDDAALRLVLKTGEAGGFDRLRREYPTRRSFNQLKIKSRKSSPEFRTLFEALGFEIRKD